MAQTKDPSGRRRFLGTSLGATTALLAGWRPAPTSAVGANDRIRVGILGTGGRARGLMRQLRNLPGHEIVHRRRGTAVRDRRHFGLDGAHK